MAIGAPDGEINFVVVIFAEISSDRSRFSFRDIVLNTEDMVIVTEADDIDSPGGPRMVYVNPAVEAVTGYSSAELIGETPRILQGSLTDKGACARIRDHLVKRKPVREKLLNYTKAGAPYWVEMNIFPLYNRFGALTHFAAVERNISQQVFQSEQLGRRNEDLRALRDNLQHLVNQRTSELRQANQKLERLAYFDTLTQIPNRRCFLDQARQQAARAARRNQQLLIGMLDLDEFKCVNDTHGHAGGDKVLVALAECLRRFFRQEDVFGRIGGEEFAFCVVVAPGTDAAVLGERLRKAVACIEIAINEDSPIRITASLGLATLHQAAGRPWPSRPESLVPEELDDAIANAMERADRQLYRAKQEGRDRVCIEPQSAG